MNTRRGADGKVYPVTRRAADRERIVGLEHTFSCKLGLSRRAVQRRLLYAHGIRRSLGAISQDLARYECDMCEIKPEPASMTRIEVYSWQ